MFNYISGGADTITKSDLSNQLTTNGIKKTAKDVDDMWKEAGGGSTCDFSQFVIMLDSVHNTLVPQAVLKQAIETIDSNLVGEFAADPTGVILADDLEKMLIELGDKLSEEEANQFLNSLKIDSRGNTRTDEMLSLLLNN